MPNISLVLPFAVFLLSIFLLPLWPAWLAVLVGRLTLSLTLFYIIVNMAENYEIKKQKNKGYIDHEWFG